MYTYVIVVVAAAAAAGDDDDDVGCWRCGNRRVDSRRHHNGPGERARRAGLHVSEVL